MNRRQRIEAGRVPAALLAVLAGIMLAGGVALPVRADTAASLGRLFLSPEQRHSLDQQRAQLPTSTGNALPKDLLPARSAAERRVVHNGVLRRSGAPPLVWINGKPAPPSAATAGGAQLRRGPDARNRVTLGSGDDGVSARLKPGQAWDPVTGEVSDCLRCGIPDKMPDGAVDTAASVPGESVVPAVAAASTPAPAAPAAAESP